MTNQDLIRVLSVDDHALLREGIASILALQSDMVLISQASGGRDAIRQYREYRPDITLMDFRMPDLGGIEALIAIRAESPAASVLMLTTSAGAEEVRRAREAGACGYMLKTLPPNDMAQVIRQVHAGDTWVLP